MNDHHLFHAWFAVLVTWIGALWTVFTHYYGPLVGLATIIASIWAMIASHRTAKLRKRQLKEFDDL